MKHRKASILTRFAALFLDGIFISIIQGILLYCISELFFTSIFFSFSYFNSTAILLILLVVIFTGFFYFALFEGSSMSATLGKKICDIMVVDEQGAKLTMRKSFLRALCRILSGAILCIGYIMALFDADGQALHDKLAHTFVILENTSIETGERTVNMNGNPQVICISGQMAGKVMPVSVQGTLIGRDAASCDIAFSGNAQGISRNHCKVQYNPQSQMFVLYDLGSTYGTFVSNGIKVQQGQPVALRSGEEFYLSSRVNLFRVSL